MYVREFMTSEVFTVTPNDTIADTIALMKEKKVNRIPVVEKGKVVGLVTDGDLREASPSPATTLSIFELNYLLAKTPIREVAIKKVITCSPDAKIEDAAILMRDNKIGGLPVVFEGKLAGIITETDIFDAFLDILGFRSPGQRITIKAKDKPGGMSDLATTIKDFGVNISSMAIYHLPDEQVEILARLSGDRIGEVKKSLSTKGYIIE